MKKIIITILMVCTSSIFSNDWEIDTNGLSMSVITGYEISNNRKFDIHRNEYYDENGRVLLKIKFSGNDGEEFWREIFRYDNEGRVTEKSTWAKEKNKEWRRNGFMKTEYYEEGENLVVIESGEVYYRTIIKDSEDRTISIENTVSNKDGSEDYSYVEYIYEKTSDGFLRQIVQEEERIISKVDFLYNDDNKVLKRNVVLDDPDLLYITENEYDVNGNITETYLYHKYRYGARFVYVDGKPVREELTEKEKQEIHFLKQTIQYEYDELGRLLVVKTTGESDKGSKREEGLFYSYYRQDRDGRYIQD